MFFLLFAVMYLAVGTAIARQVYASQYDSVAHNEIRNLTNVLASIEHGGSCYKNKQSSYYSPTRACDCSKYSAWKNAVDGLKVARESAKATNPYLIVSAWPLVGYHKYLTGGVAKNNKNYSPELIARLEKELEIK